MAVLLFLGLSTVGDLFVSRINCIPDLAKKQEVIVAICLVYGDASFSSLVRQYREFGQLPVDF